MRELERDQPRKSLPEELFRWLIDNKIKDLGDVTRSTISCLFLNKALSDQANEEEEKVNKNSLQLIFILFIYCNNLLREVSS